ncbi:MAG: type II toxin-antitoxin system PemK/MazF family toxin [Saprospiraceae bacterium]|nr:type II toxin-antitoxin system PemK/MazF family toxin [Saprospiraceae bacterium]
MQIIKNDIWIADLNPQIGTESGKTRPVVVIQTNLLNKAGHPSTIICPLTTKVELKSDILRVHIRKDTTNLIEDSDIMIDQIRAIDNNRLIKKVGTIEPELIQKVKQNLLIILDLE